MPGDFTDRMDELLARIGPGDLEGTVEVDQAYARYQHQTLDLHHPHGGQASYLQGPLMGNLGKYMGMIAATVLEDGGKAGMRDAMEDLAGHGGVATYAPVDWGDLRDSGHPEVTEDGAPVYDRPPHQHRLSAAELEAKYRLHHPHRSTLTPKQRAYLYATGILPREAD